MLLIFFLSPPYIAEAKREMRSPPLLPVITQHVLPGEGWGPGPYRLNKPAAIFNRWQLPHERTVPCYALSGTLGMIGEPILASRPATCKKRHCANFCANFYAKRGEALLVDGP